MDNRRQHYRIRYNATEGPRFVFGNSISEVIECSEGGLRFRTVGVPPERGTPVAGRVSLRCGKDVVVSGRVVWSDETFVALHLDTTPIPFLDIMREQLYLRDSSRQTV